MADDVLKKIQKIMSMSMSVSYELTTICYFISFVGIQNGHLKKQRYSYPPPPSPTLYGTKLLFLEIK